MNRKHPKVGSEVSTKIEGPKAICNSIDLGTSATDVVADIVNGMQKEACRLINNTASMI
ncbi:hypothetical protein D3C75_1287760 [compost metagenome]